MPDLDDPGEDYGGQKGGLHKGKSLSNNEQGASIPPVSEHSCEGSEHKGRDLAGKADYPKQESGIGEAVNKPAHGDLLHPGADEGDTLTGNEETVISGSQGP